MDKKIIYIFEAVKDSDAILKNQKRINRNMVLLVLSMGIFAKLAATAISDQDRKIKELKSKLMELEWSEGE